MGYWSIEKCIEMGIRIDKLCIFLGLQKTVNGGKRIASYGFGDVITSVTDSLKNDRLGHCARSAFAL